MEMNPMEMSPMEMSRDNPTACQTNRASKASTGMLVLGVLFFAAAGCRTETTRPTPLSESAVRLDLPLVHQDALYDCGLASISALCQYWGVAIPAEERAALARTAADNAGLSGSDLTAALEGLGLEVFLFHGTLDRTATGVYGQVDAGRPPLVMLSADGTVHHYGLVLGYDEPRGNLILLDPTKGEILVPVAAFDRNWARCQRFTLLACRRQEEQVALSRRGALDDEQTRWFDSKEMNP
jgi:ABC-type bacteriocin/lantibiotic exporter with double-glycine peptidase domain